MKSRLVNILVLVSMLAVAAAFTVEPVSAQMDAEKVQKFEKMVSYQKQALDHLKKGQYDLAIAEYTKLLEFAPGKAAHWLAMRGNAYQQKKQYDLAIADFTKSLEINPRDAEVYFFRGRVYYKKEQYDLVIADASKALELNPRDADAYFLRSGARVQKGLTDRASYMLVIDDLNKALEINPNFALAYWSRGKAYEIIGESAKSREDLRRATALGFRPR